MSVDYLQLHKITFKGLQNEAGLSLLPGVNVICGASDTGKSFLAESIDFMLGGSKLRQIPERDKYGEIRLDISSGDHSKWRLKRATSGGNFSLTDLNDPEASVTPLNQKHSHDKTNNLSGFLLEKIDLLGKRILRSKVKATTQSLSFRNLARLIIVQEGEIQQTGSPFWGGQHIQKTSELATIKLLLTGIDDANVVSQTVAELDNGGQIKLVDELLFELNCEVEDLKENQSELEDQMTRLEGSIDGRKENLAAYQRQFSDLVSSRRELFETRQSAGDRVGEISDLLARFSLLNNHYSVDLERLSAIQVSGSMFAHVETVSCPLCGANPDDQHFETSCEGDVEAVVLAASAEIRKIEQLKRELISTVSDLEAESDKLEGMLEQTKSEYETLDSEIRETMAPQVSEARSSFSELIEERASVQKTLDLFVRIEKMEERKILLENDEPEPGESITVESGIPDSAAHAISLKVSAILKSWEFPGDCLVHFDKESSDFVIDGKPRGSRGKGLRAITHAAVTIGLLEYCQENDLPHTGFVVLDSPLLAYFKPEGDDDRQLQGTNLKERFYSYLIDHHGENSQIIIVENQHPPSSVLDGLSMTVFTGNPNDGRKGFL